MLCGTFKKKRRSPGDEYRLVRSNTMPRIVSAREGSLVAVRRTKSSRTHIRSSLIKDLLNMMMKDKQDFAVRTSIESEFTNELALWELRGTRLLNKCQAKHHGIVLEASFYDDLDNPLEISLRAAIRIVQRSSCCFNNKKASTPSSGLL
ncbi:hypothetical protein M0802_011645 [Mischocyttarus mexicanus]|nr:hypothetical protein M0802_011645 [Mischocyttarus mexicanus]